MRFVWDARKSDRNLRERGCDSEFATQIFDSPTLERADTRRDYGERRVIALGKAQDIALTVVYTDRAEAPRSTRPGGSHATAARLRERNPGDVAARLGRSAE
ncbi:MAG: BrnT family toxin [Acidobacteria bacterium]|nr:BrnT family toxin [Acidobacteriota bacterium]